MNAPHDYLNGYLNGFLKKMIALGIASSLLSACMTTPEPPEGSAEVRSKLTQLQSDSQLATRAPVAIKDAEVAVVAAEKPQEDAEKGQHLVYLANRKVEIASALAQSRLLEDQRTSLSEQREGARLDSRTREADSARMDADRARLDTQAARDQSEELQRQIDELNARATERGLVITLGDLLFATGKSELKGSASAHLSKLAGFLNEHSDRNVIIEGHTDSVGSETSNYSLSERRADAVKRYLTGQGVDADRIRTSGLGEGVPVADNESASGRQQNRRVEVIIENSTTSSR